MKNFKEKLALVPKKPGSHQMKNTDGVIIYVGKAKNLKNRLKSYFTGTVTGKTRMLVQDIDDFEYIVTSSELESLILEITLKRYIQKICSKSFRNCLIYYKKRNKMNYICIPYYSSYF